MDCVKAKVENQWPTEPKNYIDLRNAILLFWFLYFILLTIFIDFERIIPKVFIKSGLVEWVDVRADGLKMWVLVFGLLSSNPSFAIY